ncbi:MAG: hypothetical protein DYG92_02315 [Leptolyngbya sp. PLA1]|nr:hypothetical protein [Leptolyngbya sp. PLA1]
MDPSPEAAAAIERSIDESTQTPIPLELPWLRQTRWGGLVAAAVAVAAVGAFSYVIGHRSPVPTSAPVSVSLAPERPLVIEPAGSVETPGSRAAAHASAVASRAGRPLESEMELVRRDTQRAVGQVFSRLPIFEPR